MNALDIALDGDGCWPEVAGAPEAMLLGIALLKRGTTGGKHSVMFKLRMPDGSFVLAQTTFALLDSAVLAMRTRAALDSRSN